MGFPPWLKALLLGPETDDGLGLPFWQELRFSRRVRDLRRRPMAWRRPDASERARYDDHPLIARFADDTIAIADVDGRRWVVRERMWHGWPDPPQFAAFAFDGEVIWAAADFDRWPKGWTGVDP